MERIANICIILEKILDKIIAVILILLILFSGYSLWSSYKIYTGAFLGSDLLQFKPKEISEEGKNPTLDELLRINKDIIGWITIDDTHIDYPIVQGKSNMEYVNKDVYGKFSLSGSVFLDYKNNKDFTDPYNLLYAHHMDNGAMFGDVVNFEEKDYFDKHKTGTLYLPDKTYKIDIFMTLKADAYDSIIFNPHGNESAKEVIEYADKLKLQKSKIDIEDKNIIALSTCEKATTNGRTIILGKLTQIETKKQGR